MQNLTASEWAAWAQAVGTVLAIAGAFFIARYEQSKEIQRERELRRRKGKAALALLPTALDDLCDYVDKCAKLLIDWKIPPRAGSTFPVPQLDSQLYVTLQNCIELADHNASDCLCDLLAKMQIQKSRLSDPRWLIAKHNVNASLLDTAELQARIDHLFPYARRDVEQTGDGVNRADLQKAVKLLNIDTSVDLTSLVQMRFPEGTA